MCTTLSPHVHHIVTTCPPHVLTLSTAYLVQLNRGWVATSVLVGQGDGIDGAVDQIFRGTDAVGGGGANKVKRTGVVQWLQVKTLLGGLFLVRLKIRYRRKQISKKDIEKRFRKKISKNSQCGIVLVMVKLQQQKRTHWLVSLRITLSLNVSQPLYNEADAPTPQASRILGL